MRDTAQVPDQILPEPLSGERFSRYLGAFGLKMSTASRPPASKLTEPTVTIVICTRNRPADLRNCLEGIARLQRAPNEVIVVDNTEGDKETERAARKFSARYVTEPRPGLSRARNRGLAESNTEIVAYLDDDAVPSEGWLDSLLAPFALPKVAIVTGQSIPTESLAGDTEPGPPRSLDKTGRQWFEAAAFGSLGAGCNMALRKSACEGLQLFDERLGRGAPLYSMEEHHAFVRLLMLNHSAVHVPAAIVIHPFVRRTSIEAEISQSFAYWLLIFFECPNHRREVLSYLVRRLMHKPLTWRQNTPALGVVLTSGWRVRMKAAVAGTLLYLRARKLKDE